MTRESVDLAQLGETEQTRRTHPQPGSELPAMQSTADVHVPPLLPIGGAQLVRQTSSTHGPDGYITTDPDQIHARIQRLAGKLHGAESDLSIYELDQQPQADCLLITYGVTSRAAREAVDHGRNNGMRINHLVLKTLYPVPETLLRHTIAPVSQVIVVEMNSGQYVREIERLSGAKPVIFYGRMDGELITPATIGEVLESCRAC